jgi:hypothetical protein
MWVVVNSTASPQRARMYARSTVQMLQHRAPSGTLTLMTAAMHARAQLHVGVRLADQEALACTAVAAQAELAHARGPQLGPLPEGLGLWGHFRTAHLVVQQRLRSDWKSSSCTPAARSTISTHASPQSLRGATTLHDAPRQLHPQGL